VQKPQQEHQEENNPAHEESPTEEPLSSKPEQCKKHVKEFPENTKAACHKGKDSTKAAFHKATDSTKAACNKAKDSMKACPENTKAACHTAKDSVKVHITNAKSAFRGQVSKAVEKKDAVKEFAMENPKKCVFGSLATVGTCAAGYLKGNVALEFMTKHITACTLKLNEQLKIEATFDSMKTTVSKCFTNTVKDTKENESKLVEKIRGFFSGLNMEATKKFGAGAVDATKKFGEGVQAFNTQAAKLGNYGVKNAVAQKVAAGTVGVAGLAGAGVVVAKGSKMALNGAKKAGTFAGKTREDLKKVDIRSQATGAYKKAREFAGRKFGEAKALKERVCPPKAAAAPADERR